MAKVTLDNVASGYNRQRINNNFQDIETELNDKVLYRDNPTGEANQMENDLDMNSNDITNTKDIYTDRIRIDGKWVTGQEETSSRDADTVTYDNTTSGLTATDVQAAIDEVDATLDTRGTAFTADVGTASTEVPTNADLAVDGGPSIIKIDDVTSGFNSNAVVFTCQQIESRNGNQYLAYWEGDNDYLVIAKRALTDGAFETYEFDGAGGRPLISLSVQDNHYNCSIGIDPNGRILICYNTRNSAITWRYSTNVEDITSWSAAQTGMTGANESSATYPAFIYGPNDELLFMYRDGVSGNGDVFLNSWDESGLSWSARQHPLITGTDTLPTTSPYWWNPPITESGAIRLFWCWREGSGVETNFNLNYATSFDGGLTWEKSDGTSQTVPINQSNADVALTIPQNSGLLNQGNAAEMNDGKPMIAYHADDAAGVPQLFLLRREGASWVSRQVTKNTVDYDLSGGGAKALPISRSGLVCYDDGTTVIITREYATGAGLIFYVEDGNNNFIKRGPVSQNLCGYDPQWDRRLFLETNKLDILVASLSDITRVAQWDYQTPLELWSFDSLRAIPEFVQSRIKTLASCCSSGVPWTSSSATYVDTDAIVVISSISTDHRATHARLVARARNDTTADTFYTAMKLGDDGAGGTVIFGENSYNPSAALETTTLDSGWVKLPLNGNSYVETGFLNMQIKTDGGTIRVSGFNLLLGCLYDD